MGSLNVYLLYRWEGKNENEVGRCKETGKIHVTVNHKYYRPTEVVRKCPLLALQMNNPITQPINCCIWPAVCENGLIALLLPAFRALNKPACWPFAASYLGTSKQASGRAALPRRSGFALAQRCYSASVTLSGWQRGCSGGLKHHFMGNKAKCKTTCCSFWSRWVCGHLSSSCKKGKQVKVGTSRLDF